MGPRAVAGRLAERGDSNRDAEVVPSLKFLARMRRNYCQRLPHSLAQLRARDCRSYNKRGDVFPRRLVEQGGTGILPAKPQPGKMPAPRTTRRERRAQHRMA